MVTINNSNMPCPSGYAVMIYDITEAERDTTGTMHIDLIATKRKLELTWSVLDDSAMKNVLSALESKITFSVTFYDPHLGSITKTFYKGDRSIPMLSFIDGEAIWNDFKVNLIEV